ncbi:MAG TPA: PilZ domain-containing protein [Spongiibacteraceae bacterium]|jgi:c-di-GMP-binding flagellar brake protein YcgR
MQFTDLRIPIGTRMQLNITGHDYKALTLPAQLLGYRNGATLLAYLAKKPSVTIQRDAKVSVRAGLQSAIIQFDSIIEHVSEYPYFYLHLKYPAAVVIEQQLRRFPRFELDSPANATVTGKPDDAIFAGRIVDISLNGARLVFEQKLPEQEITLSSTIFVVGGQQQLNVKASIKSVPATSTDDSSTFVYGASFLDVSAAQKLLLQALCFELQSGEEK